MDYDFCQKFIAQIVCQTVSILCFRRRPRKVGYTYCMICHVEYPHQSGEGLINHTDCTNPNLVCHNGSLTDLC